MTAPTALAYRQFTPRTLSDLKDEIAGNRATTESVDLPLSEIDFKLDSDDPHFLIRGQKVAYSPTGVTAFGNFLQIPSPFFKRTGRELGVARQGDMLKWFMDTTSSSGVRISYTEAGVQSVTDPERKLIDPLQLVNVAEKVLGTTDAEVVRLIDTPETYAFDVHVPESFDHGIGGDRPEGGREVGDITAGGITIAYDRKRNHAPEVGSFLYRLICTNGMRTEDMGLRIDARGSTVDEVLAELEAMADRAFKRVERQIAHFYQLRDQRVDNAERELIAIAREHRIPDRSLVQLTRQAASNALPDDPTRFDLVNLITNFANDPSIRNDGGRLLLESAGGSVVQDEATRCGHCHSRLVSH